MSFIGGLQKQSDYFSDEVSHPDYFEESLPFYESEEPESVDMIQFWERN